MHCVSQICFHELHMVTPNSVQTLFGNDQSEPEPPSLETEYEVTKQREHFNTVFRPKYKLVSRLQVYVASLPPKTRLVLTLRQTSGTLTSHCLLQLCFRC